MTSIIECVPNISEGRDLALIDALAAALRTTPGVTLLDYSSDESHNRSVFTFIGEPDAVCGAAFDVARFVRDNIDLTRHTGEHPRMGALDVCPFVPLKGADMALCARVACQLGERVARELSIPVILYEEVATAEHRRNLADVRRGGFEGMAEKLAKPEWTPDFGESVPHPTAGVTAVGARMPLVAFNVNLSTGDVAVAAKIARVVRGSGGGLKYCKAIGVKLHARDVAQVSMNLVNYNATPVYRAFELIKAEARRYGVRVIGSELIGLAPAQALIDCAEYYLKLEGFDFDRQVLDNHIT